MVNSIQIWGSKYPIFSIRLLNWSRKKAYIMSRIWHLFVNKDLVAKIIPLALAEYHEEHNLIYVIYVNTWGYIPLKFRHEDTVYRVYFLRHQVPWKHRYIEHDGRCFDLQFAMEPVDK